MKTTPASLVIENLKVADPRVWGPTSRSPLLTKKARALAARAPASAIQELTALLREHLGNGPEEVLREALVACPDPYSYFLLFGFLARAACEWYAIDGGGEMSLHCLFGIPLTLHANDESLATGWTPSDWGPGNNEQSVQELVQVLKRTGVAAGMDDLVVLPHLVDPDAFLKIDFSEMPQLAAGLVHRPGDVRSHPSLAHRPWEPVTGGAQYRVLVMASRGRVAPRGLEDHNERCTQALSAWAERSFRVPGTLSVVGSSPERILSLLTGKGMHMGNCARLVQLLGKPAVREPGGASPFVTVDAAATRPCEGELRFSRAGSTCVWQLHGRTTWGEDMQALKHFLAGPLARFARTRLGLNDLPRSELDALFG